MVLESSSLVQTTVVLGGLGYTGTTLPPVHKAVTLRGYMRWILAAFTLYHLRTQLYRDFFLLSVQKVWKQGETSEQQDRLACWSQVW